MPEKLVNIGLYGLGARRLAGLAPVLLAGLLGCLDLTAIEVPEPDVNTGPVFLEDRVLPRPSRVPILADIGDDCVHTAFTATLLDYDGDPELHAKWIMHAQLRSGGEDVDLPPRQLKEEPALPTQLDPSQILGGQVAGAVLYRALELELSKETLLNAFDNPEALAAASGFHLLELYVSDHRFGPGSTNVEPIFAEGEPKPVVAYTSWVIDLTDTPNCGELP